MYMIRAYRPMNYFHSFIPAQCSDNFPHTGAYLTNNCFFLCLEMKTIMLKVSKANLALPCTVINFSCPYGRLLFFEFDLQHLTHR